MAALLQLWRPVVGEIVLAVDADGDEGTLDAADGLADKMYLFDKGKDWYLERSLGWLHKQCEGDWIIRIDDDEVPSAAMLNDLPQLLEETTARCVHTPRRWLFPAAESYIDEKPWTPDWQLRILRNEPGAFVFPGAIHTTVETMGPRHFAADLPIYHADLLLQPVELRRGKATRYRGLRGSQSRREALAVNAMYLPEDRETLGLATVPGEDSSLIRRVLDARPDAWSGERPAGVRVVSAAEMRRGISPRSAQAAFRARRLSSKLFRVMTRREDLGRHPHEQTPPR